MHVVTVQADNAVVVISGKCQNSIVNPLFGAGAAQIIDNTFSSTDGFGQVSSEEMKDFHRGLLAMAQAEFMHMGGAKWSLWKFALVELPLNSQRESPES